MKNILYVLLVVFFFSSCSNKKIEFSLLKLEQKTTLPCDEECTYVKIQVPQATTKSDVSDSINTHIQNISKEIIYFGSNPKAVVNYKEIMQSFIDSFEEMQEKFPEEIMPWEATVEGEVTYQSDDLVNIEINYYNYAGGVHGFSGVRSLLIDKNNGKLLQHKDLFKDIIAFSKIAEARFRKTYAIEASKGINTTGFMFEKNQFQLPENIVYSEKGITLFYNTYEISSYTDGPIELFFSFDEISGSLKIK